MNLLGNGSGLVNDGGILGFDDLEEHFGLSKSVEGRSFCRGVNLLDLKLHLSKVPLARLFVQLPEAVNSGLSVANQKGALPAKSKLSTST
jgi:hypothetical protein